MSLYAIETNFYAIKIYLPDRILTLPILHHRGEHLFHLNFATNTYVIETYICYTESKLYAIKISLPCLNYLLRLFTVLRAAEPLLYDTKVNFYCRNFCAALNPWSTVILLPKRNFTFLGDSSLSSSWRKVYRSSQSTMNRNAIPFNAQLHRDKCEVSGMEFSFCSLQKIECILMTERRCTIGSINPIVRLQTTTIA